MTGFGSPAVWSQTFVLAVAQILLAVRPPEGHGVLGQSASAQSSSSRKCACDNKREVAGANNVKVLLTTPQQMSVSTRDTRMSTMITDHAQFNCTCTCVD